MQDVRNALGKLVCRADRKLRRVEIVRKGQLTVLTFEMIIAAEMLRRSRLRCCGVPRCAATR